MSTKAIHHQHSFSKYLFAVILLLSFFNFSGFSIAPVQIKTDTQQTGLPANTQRKPIKSLSYKSALNQLSLIRYQGSFLTADPHYLAIHHSLLFNLVITTHGKPNVCTQNTNLFYSKVNVSKNDDDDDLKC